jgi:hypothetical protein
MRTVITAAGDISHKESGETNLAEMQKLVGGYVQEVPLFGRYKGQACQAYCNEEGKLRNLPVNETATRLWKEQVPGHRGDLLVGDIVILTGKDRWR